MSDHADLPNPSQRPAAPLSDVETTSAADAFTFLAHDANYDGELSRDEFETARSDHDRQQDPRRFERYDADGNGVISREEFMAGMAQDRAQKPTDGPSIGPDTASP
ncbi:MAG: EF-hand domain-containing protein [Candidatus Sericytochromatia bacterium]|nr:EF-hand domain-containing protein [Candidatus Sericytochromatia bacterium]